MVNGNSTLVGIFDIDFNGFGAIPASESPSVDRGFGAEVTLQLFQCCAAKGAAWIVALISFTVLEAITSFKGSDSRYRNHCGRRSRLNGGLGCGEC
jgi:hypothetical protein